ncbi:class I SAM-dependent methyltransferase [Chitinimonas arctica]|uniref:Class I SAM-dependent methyltransferase n=1 Tax=Chitinimonas arctica TaxID=2594795 RepID=A0A516SCP7_9NEIS|nr:class I SAM-dependent methyltransferase [Chitinimonas arctica]QDQ25828.1 class I SAM-dependent methyltransferase [Chitinimonas arctica]
MSTDTLDQGVRYDAKHAAAYDRKIRQLIPGYDTLHELSTSLLAELLPNEAAVLVAGSGTGEELLRFATAMPNWQLSGIEPSAEMNRLAADKYVAAGLGGRIQLIEGRPGDVVIEPPAGHAAFDAVTALLVMHFLPDDSAKAAFLRALAAVLKPGGWLLLADLGGQRNEPGYEQLFRCWRRQQDSSRDRPEQVELDFSHLARNVHPLAPARRDALLRQAGLQVCQEYWRALGLAAVLVQKTAQA